ncbi:carotenoid ester lipase precursor [Cylindrobasidium torrendii FP15055 ss-10]|uniref:Carboxylic ester hydrolase n=1 Tax=Cylindrobasidium torrendii FP15055 ss-10 TaxID=1314674 RepID=A0A0D7BDN7_9AGAR|nr:carotenoid ester lipase precursor [Cylindrobasidium torrendii FP15055 ss-10]
MLRQLYPFALIAAVFATELPTILVDDATFVGTSDAGVESYLGIPFAQPPTGSLRFNLPQAVEAYSGTVNATNYGPVCPQQLLRQAPDLSGIPNATAELVSSGYVGPTDYGEDCLSVNVIRPANADNYTDLPVVAWMFGGAFEVGGTFTPYHGTDLVSHSISIGKPVIYVSMNNRVSAFGFLASKEVKDAGVGNLGLHDQRLALKWIQKYIGSFGGDASLITLWGGSAGAISIASQLVAYDGNTEGLFHGIFAQSGSPMSVGDLTDGQKYYDFLVEETGCSDATSTLDCLREAEYETLLQAMSKTPLVWDYESLHLAWLPRVDGVLFSDNPQRLLEQKKVAQVPIITGDADDEGTLFTFSQLNITTDEEFSEYIATNYLPGVPEDDVRELLELYPSTPSEGSPFDTGDENALTPQFKRLAAIQGDIMFQAPRRFLLNALAGYTDIWTFIYRRDKNETPGMGTYHGHDVANSYSGGELADYLVNFMYDLDPNGGNSTVWPKWTPEERSILSLDDGETPVSVQQDTFRQDAIQKVWEVFLEYPWA